MNLKMSSFFLGHPVKETPNDTSIDDAETLFLICPNLSAIYILLKLQPAFHLFMFSHIQQAF